MKRYHVIGLVGAAGIVAVFLAVWWTQTLERPSVGESPVSAADAGEVSIPESGGLTLENETSPIVTNEPFPFVPEDPAAEVAPADPQPEENEPAPDFAVISEETLPGTRWEQDEFAIEFRETRQLFIGGKPRAKWRIVGSRVELYDDKGEVHWLDIEGNKLMWQGQEIGLVH